MNPQDLPFIFEPKWFIPAFVLLWLASAAVMSRIAGWATLAAAYPEQNDAAGANIRFVSGALGSSSFPIRYRNCLRLRISPKGLGVALMFPFNFRSPPFFVPWTDIESAQESQLIRTRNVVLRFRGQSKCLSLKGVVGQHVFVAYRDAAAGVAA